MFLQKLSKKPPAFHAALFIITLVPLYLASYQYRSRHPSGDFSKSAAEKAALTSAEFHREWLDVHVVQPFNPSAIAIYCNRSEWRPNLVFNLANANGGIGNVRGNILDFLFYAIEAGASIMLPGMAARSHDDISNVWADRAPFDLMFDEEWFLWAMGRACPQMTIYKPREGQQMVDALPGNYLPRSRRMDADHENAKDAYLSDLDTWLKSKSEFKPESLTLVNLERTLWEVDTRSLPLSFRRNFGQLLRITPSVRRLAATAVYNLAARHHLPSNPQTPIAPYTFFGAHLRTEADAQNAGWLNEPNTNFTAQTDAYIQHAEKHKLRVMYVATGNATDLARFKEKAASHAPPITVTSKLDLLPPELLKELQRLTWDQQALVDYEVLQRSSVFGGFVKSSFAYNIAMTRNQWLEDQGRVTDPWYITHTDAAVAFDDGISRMIARDQWHEQRIPRGMWP